MSYRTQYYININPQLRILTTQKDKNQSTDYYKSKLFSLFILCLCNINIVVVFYSHIHIAMDYGKFPKPSLVKSVPQVDSLEVSRKSS